MTDQAEYPENDARHYTTELRQMLDDVVLRCRANLHKANDPRAQALLETTAQVCSGLSTAFDHYEKREPAWR